MPTFDTINQLSNYVKKTTVREVAEKTGEVGEDKINERVEQNLYSKIDGGDFYENTFGLRNNAYSVIKEKGFGQYESDTMIRPEGEYPSDPGGVSQKDNIVGWIEDGHKGFYKNKAINYEGRDIFEGANKDMTKGGFLKKTIGNYLKSIGYVISRGRGSDG